MKYLLLFFVLVGCSLPERRYKGSIGSNLAVDRVVDKEYNIVCYKTKNSSYNLSCVKINN